MAWELARPSDLDDLVAFLTIDEWGHVAFSSRIVNRGMPNPHRISVHVNRVAGGSSRFREAVFVGRGGLILPVLTGSNDLSPRRDIGSLLDNGSRSLHSIMGLRADVARVQGALDRTPRAVIDYHLMVLDPLRFADGGDPTAERREEREAVDHAEGPTLRIKRARPKDLLALFPLQREYEKEEVLLDPEQFNATATYMHLQQHIKREVIFYAASGRRIVAKAGTNAQGIRFSQIGGVYTVHDLRNRGIAARLMSRLIAHLLEHRREVCLFVKPENSAAVSLYQRLGFRRRDVFRITYYGA